MLLQRYISVLAVICCITGSKVSAQYPLSTTMSLEGYVNKSGKYLMQIGDNREVIGSPYLDDMFKKGDVRMDGDWYRGSDLRFDSYEGVFEVKLNEGIFVIDPVVDGVDSILYNREIFVSRSLTPGDPQRRRFLVALYQEDTYALYKKYGRRLNNPVKSDGYNEAKPAEYKPNPPAYIIFKEENPLEVKGTGSIADIFGVDRKTVSRYTRQNKYKLNKEKDLIEIVTHFSEVREQ
jgi:hypothetical protein